MTMTQRGVRVGLTVGACLMAVLWLSACSKQAEPPAKPIPSVTVAVIQPQTVSMVSDLPGRVSAYRIAQVRTRVDGVVIKRDFVEGSDVKAGQRLYLIDPAPYQAEFNSANAALTRAKANLTARALQASRAGTLLTRHAISQQDVDDINAAHKQAQADVTAANAALDAARIRLEYTEVRAPIDGRIGKSQVTEGAYVRQSEGTLLATVQQLDQVYIDVTQSAAEVLRLRRELEQGLLKSVDKNTASVSLKLEDGSRYAEPGQLQFSDISVDESTGSVTLRALFHNPKTLLLPGMFVHAQLEMGVNQQALLVPQQAVTYNAVGKPTTLVVKQDSTVELRVLQISRSVGNQWLVTDGISPGDRVITEGLQKVKPGAAVKVEAEVVVSGAPATGNQ